MRRKNIFKAQSTLEYAVIVAVVVAALLAIQIYMKRGIQGKLRESTDQVGEQFEAEKTTMNRQVIRSASTTQTVSGGKTSVNTAYDNRTESGQENVGAW